VNTALVFIKNIFWTSKRTLSSILSCMILYFLSSTIRSHFSCDSSDKSDDKLLGVDHDFFFIVSTPSAFILIWGVLCKEEAISGITVFSAADVSLLASDISKLFHKYQLHWLRMCWPMSWYWDYCSLHLQAHNSKGIYASYIPKLTYFSMFSSFFRHLKCDLHVWSIRDWCEKKRWEF